MRMRSWVLISAVVLIWVAVLIAFLAVLKSPSGPQYTSAEQGFLNELHHSPYSWNSDDPELVRQGHQVCRLLDANGGDEDALEEPRLFGYGSSSMPGFMQAYGSLDQRHELVLSATVHFCNEYTLYIGNHPV